MSLGLDVIPSRGCCHAVFLLAHTARLKRYNEFGAWVGAARSKATVMAAALDLDAVAKELLALNLVKASPISVRRSLLNSGERAETSTFARIAGLLLEAAPPAWLRVAVSESGVVREYIPEGHLRSMLWLGDDLDGLLLRVWRKITAASDDDLRERIGRAAELVVFTALERQGGEVIHVSEISDSYGYDIEYRGIEGTQRLEVKGALEHTRDSFILSRNEFDKASFFGSEWRLVQVTFGSAVVVEAEPGTIEAIEVRELSSEAILALAPSDDSSFRWREAAFTPPSGIWERSRVASVPGTSTIAPWQGD